MTSAHAFELPPDASPLTEAVDAAEHGQVVYLTRNGEPIAAIVPADVAVMCQLLGVSEEDFEVFRGWTTDIGLVFSLAHEGDIQARV